MINPTREFNLEGLFQNYLQGLLRLVCAQQLSKSSEKSWRKYEVLSTLSVKNEWEWKKTIYLKILLLEEESNDDNYINWNEARLKKPSNLIYQRGKKRVSIVRSYKFGGGGCSILYLVINQ